MKKSLLVLFGLALSAIITGCASSPSAEDQVKLIDYEQCLSAERDKWSISLQGTPSSTIQWMESRWELEDKILFDFFKKTCEKYRP
jgi:hypothetical protein